MKKAFTLVVLIVTPTMAFAQGTVVLQNETGLVKTWTSATDPTLIGVVKGSATVEFIAAPTGTSLTPLGAQTPIGFVPNYPTFASFLAANPGWQVAAGSGNPGLVNAAAGLFNNGIVTIGNIAEGANAEYEIIGWTGAYTSYDAALAADAMIAISALTTTATGDPLSTPPGLPVSLKTTFGGLIFGIPEPSTSALVGLGAAALMIFRRRR